jgi:hypothetical protein
MHCNAQVTNETLLLKSVEPPITRTTEFTESGSSLPNLNETGKIFSSPANPCGKLLIPVKTGKIRLMLLPCCIFPYKGHQPVSKYTMLPCS